MPQNYRYPHESGRPQEQARGGRFRTGGEMNRDRYETGNERRYNPDFDDRSQYGSQYDESSGGYEGNRSYSAGGYPEEFGYRRDRGMSDRGTSDRNMSSGGYSRLDEDRFYSGDNSNRYGNDRFNEPNRFGANDNRSNYGGDFSSQYSRGGDYGQGSQYGRGGQLHSGEFGRQWEDEQSRFGSQNYGGYGSGYGSSGMSGSNQRFGNYGANQNYGASNQYSNSERLEYGSQGNFGRNFGSESGQYGGSLRNQFSGQSQSHRGRGPKGYERSDDRLKEMICERLTEDHTIDASEVTVDVTGKNVKLTGTVDSRQTKFQIEDLVERCGGVKDIDNQLRVQSASSASNRDNEWSSSSQSESASGRSSNESRSGLSGTSTTSGMTTGSTTPSKRN